MHILFAFDNSYIITSIKELYFMIIKEVIKSYKNGDIFFYWNDKIIKKTKQEMDKWILNKNILGGDTLPHFIVEEANKQSLNRKNLLKVTDGRVNESVIEKCII